LGGPFRGHFRGHLRPRCDSHMTTAPASRNGSHDHKSATFELERLVFGEVPGGPNRHDAAVGHQKEEGPPGSPG